MTVTSIPIEQMKEQEFNSGQVLTVVGGHFIHDTFSGMVSPLLPVLIEKYSLSLTAAGSLSAVSQIPALLNPFFGYLSDRYNLQVLIMLAPAVTATIVSCLGLAPNTFILAFLLLISGISTAAFHASAPAIVGRAAGNRVGKGMSWLMAGGGSGFTVGPLLIVWAVSAWTLEGSYRLMVIGWVTSLILFLRLRNVSAMQATRWQSVRTILPRLPGVFLPITGYIFFRYFMVVPLTVFLPTYMKMQNASLWMAGGALSILELAGVGGALASGSLSDRWGRKSVLITSILGSFVFLLLFLFIDGWLLVPALLILGFMASSIGPVMLAVVQEHFPTHRAVTNGLYMAVNFLLQPVATVIIGMMGDRWGLHTTFLWGGIIALLAVPSIIALPEVRRVTA